MARKKTVRSRKSENLSLNSVKLGLAVGIVVAVCVFLTTLLGVGGYFPGYVKLSAEWLGSIYGYFGYKVSVAGAFLGAVYSFIDSFIVTWIFATIYNKLL